MLMTTFIVFPFLVPSFSYNIVIVFVISFIVNIDCCPNGVDKHAHQNHNFCFRRMLQANASRPAMK